MNKHTYYTAVGSFQRRTDCHGQSYPVIIINQKEYCVDIQEMALWTTLSWRLKIGSGSPWRWLTCICANRLFSSGFRWSAAPTSRETDIWRRRRMSVSSICGNKCRFARQRTPAKSPPFMSPLPNLVGGDILAMQKRTP